MINNEENDYENQPVKLSVNFIANAGVKDIVGRGLIYNDNVAIIELIKNAKDAASDKAVLVFCKNSTVSTSIDLINPVAKIMVKDFGLGMTRTELKEKWLNIAYSEKKNNKERTYAGNKGVGRFSCDRLGKKLELYTKSKEDGYLKMTIDWTDFENKGKDDVISSVPLEIEILQESIFLKEIDEPIFKQGTTLIISNLRSVWQESKVKKLISEIEKFSPSLDNTFDVIFESDISFKDKDLKGKSNKKINNNILEKLVFKTTYIKSSIDSNGEFLESTLYFQGEKVYYYKAKNPYPNLKNVIVEIHYLDTLSKSYFTRNFGVKPNNYGSVFLFYNSFRISPYGNEKNDWLGLDQRKSQGVSRHFGTRDIIGRIDVIDNNDDFSVITSREGLVHNQAYFELVAFDHEDRVELSNGKKEYGYVSAIIRQLESFVVNGIDWNRLVDTSVDTSDKRKVVSANHLIREPDRYISKALSENNIRNEARKVITSNFEIIDFFIDDVIISKVKNINEEKFRKFVNDFVKVTEDKTIYELSNKEKGIVKKIIDTSQRKVFEAEELIIKTKDENVRIEKSLDIEKKKHAYLLATRRTLSPDADGLIHTIKINNIEMNEGIDSLIEGIQFDELDKNEIISKLTAIKLYSMKSLKMAELATRSGFDRDIDIRSVDIVKYINEYLNIYENTIGSNDLEISFSNENVDFIRSISVLNLSIILDNLLSNSSKWGATKVSFSFEKASEVLKVLISDDGFGLSDLFQNTPDEIFSLGVRDESPGGGEGSGIGLYYTRELLAKMNAQIRFVENNHILSGACFEVVFK